MLDNNFLFSKIIIFTSFEQSRTTIDLSAKRMFVISEQTKSLSKPRKDGFIAKLNRLTRTSLTKDKDPEGMSPDRTILSDSFFVEKLGERGLFETTEAAAIAQPFVADIEEREESNMSAHFRSTGVAKF